MDSSIARVRLSGKFFRAGRRKWYAKGFCYGPFAQNRAGEPFPEPPRVSADFAHMRRLGATCVRTYFPPPPWLLELALENELRVFIDIPWQKHRCFLEDWSTQEEARGAVTETARQLGGSPAVFAISVANEIPNDIVRFYGAPRVQSFLDELLDRVHQAAPECLATYANFPTTEFLQPTQQDFCCFNVYLNDPEAFARYLDRLQHIAGGAPLVVGEFGVDSLSIGHAEQAKRLSALTRVAFRHGVAGGFVFSYTDDWFTGGHQIEQWAFGVTSPEREEKRAAWNVARVWKDVPQATLSSALPKVSVVVCSYNGAATLAECLQSLMRLNYFDYEVILVDDGSFDHTVHIASQFPQVRYIRQSNQGLSVARNVGLRAATGEIVAYTDSDCVADEDWLLYLVGGLHEQQVDGIGGPNLTPPSDNWVAQCVAASPGNPSHVMFDDCSAEHLPGCNMAFRREALLSIGGFDPQFRQAGDDVDVCWRLLAGGRRLGYAAGAMVWHHRRCSVKAYYQQQKGYGRAEAMLAFKHPHRFIGAGLLKFDGVIYGDGTAGLPLLPPKVYHGRFGAALFQTIYQPREFRFDARATSLEWHCLSATFLVLSTMNPWLLVASGGMWLVSMWSVAATVGRITRPKKFPGSRQLLVLWLHLMQPVVRGMHRNGYALRNKRLPQIASRPTQNVAPVRKSASAECEHYWPAANGKGRIELLDALVAQAKQDGWPGDYYGGWSPWDVELMADVWHHVTVRTATEELGRPKRFTRVRWAAQPTRIAYAATAMVLAWNAVAIVMNVPWGMFAGLAAAALLLTTILRSRSRCLLAVGDLLARAAAASGLAGPDVGKDQTDQHTTRRTRNAKRPSGAGSAVAVAPTAPWTPSAQVDFIPARDQAPL
ncbi:MAG TPA: glycosyltransferase family A protein [Lacipirellula sp.]